jgi:hypothetical protein
VAFARSNRINIAIGICVGCALQIALVVAPILVLVSWAIGHQINLVFDKPLNLFAIAGAAFVVRAIAADAETNWFEGFLLVGVYVLFALANFFHGQRYDSPTATPSTSSGASTGQPLSNIPRATLIRPQADVATLRPTVSQRYQPRGRNRSGRYTLARMIRNAKIKGSMKTLTTWATMLSQSRFRKNSTIAIAPVTPAA